MIGNLVWDETISLDEGHLIEMLAGRVVADALCARVLLTDLVNERGGAFDLEIAAATRTGLGEVVSVKRNDLRSQRQRIFHLRADRYTTMRGLTHRWLVFLEPRAKPDAVIKALPEMLADLERDGLLNAHFNNSAVMRNIGHRVGVRRCSSLGGAAEGGYRLQPSSTGGWASDHEAVLRAIEEFCRTTDVGLRKLRKLTRIAAGHRHLAVVVTPEEWPDVYHVLRDSIGVPSRPPQLDVALDGLWIVPFAATGRAIFHLEGQGWASAAIDGWTPPGWSWG